MSILDAQISEAKRFIEQAQREHAPAAFACSFGAEDMVLADLIARGFPQIEIFTLDTGRLPEETHRLMRTFAERYSVEVRTYLPDSAALELHLRERGVDSFYQSVELRKRCCHLRKVEPLRRALAGKRSWITGLRREQAASRANVRPVGYDEEYGLYKFNPLTEWTNAQVWDYIRRNDVPYNSLHDRGYPSIGCAPCTRAITVGEDPRAGRWWWENEDAKECGLHERHRKPLAA